MKKRKSDRERERERAQERERERASENSLTALHARSSQLIDTKAVLGAAAETSEVG